MKAKVQYICQNCGAHSPFWVGRCSECSEWNTIVEELDSAPIEALSHRQCQGASPQIISEVILDSDARSETGMQEFDRILGGGIVAGSLTLIGGDPGIGKSTLLLQIANALAVSGDQPILYVSGEESVRQLKIRAERLDALSKKLLVVSETNTDKILKHIHDVKPALVVIDSIQVVFRPDIPSAPGSVSQVRECAAVFMYLAKNEGIPIFLVGHVTKDGSIAGPRVLEHMVDTVLYFEGEKNYQYRILRAVKNRFGATNEIGVFDMQSKGLMEVPNPSELLLSERSGHGSGSVVAICMEGTRPLLIEIQALVSPASGFGIPRRTSTGIDSNRLSMIIAVLEKRCGLKLGDQDIFVNVTGGLKIVEPSIDLALAVALKSSFEDRSVEKSIVFCGEIGLGGEIRAVSHMNFRLKEAEKLGFQKAVIPALAKKSGETKSKMHIEYAKEISDVFKIL